MSANLLDGGAQYQRDRASASVLVGRVVGRSRTCYFVPPTAPKIVAPTFNCDYSLGDKIPEPLPRGSFFWSIIGAPATGKSSHLISLLSARRPNRAYRGVFEDVYFVVIPTASQASLRSSLFLDHDQTKIFPELDGGTLTEIMNRVEVSAAEGYSSLLVLLDAFTVDGASTRRCQVDCPLPPEVSATSVRNVAASDAERCVQPHPEPEPLNPKP